MSMTKRMTILLSLVMIPALVVLFTVGRGQEGQISSESIAKSISQFNDSNPDNRMQAFEALIQRGSGSILNGDVNQISSALAKIFKALPDSSDELKIGLITLLKTENLYMQQHAESFKVTGQTLSEDYVNYHGNLIFAVSSLRDSRAVDSLVGCIESGEMATSGLAQLGVVAMDPVINLLNNKNESVRLSATIVLVGMLDQNEILQEANPVSRDKIKNAIIRSAKDNNHYTRISAINGLEKLSLHGDGDAVKLLEQLAQNDPFESVQQGGKSNEYPVRDAANKALRKKN